MNAVAHGLDQRSKASYATSHATISAPAIHFERSAVGHVRVGVIQRRRTERGAMSGQAMHAAFATARIATTAKPRQCVHGKVPARFIGASCVPTIPSMAMSAANASIASRSPSRTRGWRNSAPITGMRNRSRGVSRAGARFSTGNESSRGCCGARTPNDPLAIKRVAVIAIAGSR